jgi:hypothetical protein
MAALKTMRPFSWDMRLRLDRGRVSLLPDRIEDYVGAAGAVVRMIDVFVDGLDIARLGFRQAVAASTGRPCYDPARSAEALYLQQFQRSPLVTACDHPL